MSPRRSHNQHECLPDGERCEPHIILPNFIYVYFWITYFSILVQYKLFYHTSIITYVVSVEPLTLMTFTDSFGPVSKATCVFFLDLIQQKQNGIKLKIIHDFKIEVFKIYIKEQ